MKLPTLELLLEIAPDAMLAVDRDGIITAVNALAERLFGGTAEELVGHPIEALVPERFQDAHRSYRAHFQRRPRARPMGELDLFARRLDGGEFPCEVSLSPTEVEDSVYIMVAIRDITQRKQVEAKFRRFLDAAPDALVIVDADGVIELVNSQAERLFGYTRGQLLGQPIELLMPARSRAQHVGHRAGFFAAPVVRSMGTGRVLFGRCRDGTEFPVEISLSPIETESGLLVASAIRDISDRRKAEAVLRQAHDDLAAKSNQLEAANGELEAFSYSVAHDLRAPLRGMMGFAQILEADYGATLPEDGRECLAEIHASGKKMGALIDALLALSRVTRSPLLPDLVDLGALVRACVSDLSLAEPDRQVEVVIAEETEVVLDPRLARVLIDNLVSNAWKFTQRTPLARIELGVERAGGAVTYFVRDNGAGFDQAYAGMLFSPFQRLHAARDYPGTGIGLATVHRILARHGGRIWTEGAVGEGATFWFTVSSRESVAP